MAVCYYMSNSEKRVEGTQGTKGTQGTRDTIVTRDTGVTKDTGVTRDTGDTRDTGNTSDTETQGHRGTKGTQGSQGTTINMPFTQSLLYNEESAASHTFLGTEDLLLSTKFPQKTNKNNTECEERTTGVGLMFLFTMHEIIGYFLFNVIHSP